MPGSPEARRNLLRMSFDKWSGKPCYLSKSLNLWSEGFVKYWETVQENELESIPFCPHNYINHRFSQAAV